MAISVKINKKGLNLLKRKLNRLEKTVGRVGYFADQDIMYKDSDGAPIPLWEVAHHNEFGYKKKNKARIPPRPFFRDTMYMYGEHYADRLALTTKNYLFEGKALQVLPILNEMKLDIARTIRDFYEPPNAPLTIKLKGSDDVLNAGGLMMNSVEIRYEDGL